MNLSTCIFTLLLLLSISVRQSLAGKVTPPTDVLFIIDGSGSMKSDNFDRLRVLLKEIIDGLQNARVALIQFSSRKLTKVEFNLDTFINDKEGMKRAIDDMVYQRKYTYTGFAMEMARKEVFNGKGGDRPFAKNVILLFTDGFSADPHVAEEETKQMKAHGDHVMTVGFGPPKLVTRFKHELEVMSSNKDKDVFLNGFDDQEKIADRLSEASLPKSDCSTSPCLNGARCENRGDGFVCYCTDDWYGPRCGQKKGPCAKKPCLNGGTCVENGDEFTCICNGDFHGELCEKKRVVCTTKNVDILLIVDDSRSISDNEYGQMKDFLKKLVYRFNISEDQSHVALIQFSDNAQTEFHLNTAYNKEDVMRRINALVQSDGGYTYTNLAFKKAREEIFNGEGGDRTDVRDVVILLTDGESQSNASTIMESGLLKRHDVSIISIGVGMGEEVDDFDRFLQSISSGDEYVFKVGFTNLDTILDGVTKAACENLQDT